MNVAASSEITRAKSPYAQLTFAQLQDAYKKAGKPLAESFQQDLNLLTPKGGYNLLAFLLSDQNDRALVVNRYSGFNKDISIDAEHFTGSLVAALPAMQRFMHQENLIHSKAFERKMNDQVPRTALDAALVNAVAHNDWVGCAAPVVDVFCDRFEVLSFGMDSIEQAAAAGPVWPALMKVLVDLGFAQGKGAGVPAIVAEFGPSALAMPTFGVNVVTLPFVVNTLYSGKFAAPMMDDVERLCEAMGNQPRTAAELMNLVQEVYYPTFLERFLQPALAKGAIAKQGEEADSRQQVYVRV